MNPPPSIKEVVKNPDSSSEKQLDSTLRPTRLSDYVGQPRLRQQLDVFMSAARQRKEALDHVLLFGPPGLGKTTLAMIIAKEMQTKLHLTTGPALERPGDIAALMSTLNTGDVLLIDEIHRLHPAIEETMYSALEDFRLDIVIGETTTAKAVKIDLPHFTLVGATTKAGRLSAPLRDRFGIVCNLEYYTLEDMQKIIRRNAQLLGMGITDDGVATIALGARRTPRIANRLLRRVRDFAQVKKATTITDEIAQSALSLLGVDRAGLDGADLRYLSMLIEKFRGGPVGLDTLALASGDSIDTVESFIEPYLIKEGFIARLPRGRIATPLAYQHFGLPPTKNKPEPASSILPQPLWEGDKR